MTTETAPETILESLQEGGGSELSIDPESEIAGSIGTTLEEPAEKERVPRFGDPRRAVVDVLRDRLEHVLQPVDEDVIWHGVNVITAKDLELVTAEDLPPASIFAASVRTPAFIYVDAVCPVCGIAGEITVELDAKLTATRNGRKLALGAKATALPHQCGQLRIRDVGPNRPAKGQTTAFDREAPDRPDAEDEAWMNAPMGTPLDRVDDEDLRPSGEVNADELQAAARKDVLEAERSTDGADSDDGTSALDDDLGVLPF